MRLAFIQAGLGAGGTERVVSLLVNDRHARGDDVHIFAFVSDDDTSYFNLPEEVIVHRLPDHATGPFSRGILKSVKRIFRLRAELRNLRPDVVLSFLTKINIVCLLSTRWLGIPVLISERNNPDAQPKHFLWKMIEPLILRQAHRLIMQTQAITKKLPMSLRAKAVVIGNPCDRGQTAQSDGKALRAVAAGRLVDQKGFDTLIEAFACISADVPEWSLTIYGEGPHRKRLQDRIEALDIEDRVSLPGVTAKAGSWVDAAALFVLSSRYEGFPNVLTEAMAAGLPVISTQCDFGPAEIVDDGVSGLLVPVDDVGHLAAALKMLMLDDVMRRRLAKAGYDSVLKYSVAVIMGQWDACIRQAARSHQKSTLFSRHANLCGPQRRNDELQSGD
jgi:glycosyltransferase involved in cell wall biosynthesis